MDHANAVKSHGGVRGGGLNRPRYGIRAAKKNQIKPWQVHSWCIPPKDNAQFVAKMEDVLEVYSRPYDPKYPQVCLDEKRKELRGTPRGELPIKAGKAKREDYEYKRNSSANVFLWNEPLTGRCGVTVEEAANSFTFAHIIKDLVDIHYSDAHKIVLVCDNASFHNMAALYKAFPPEEAFRLNQKIEWHHTPEHGSWLDMAQVELAVFGRQCLNRRIPDIKTLKSEAKAWETKRNSQKVVIQWRFTNADARIKLKHLYPKRLSKN